MSGLFGSQTEGSVRSAAETRPVTLLFSPLCLLKSGVAFIYFYPVTNYYKYLHKICLCTENFLNLRRQNLDAKNFIGLRRLSRFISSHFGAINC